MMPRYLIVGASMVTGADVQVAVEAATPMEAAEKARSMSIAVSRIDIDPVTASPLTPEPAMTLRRAPARARSLAERHFGRAWAPSAVWGMWAYALVGWVLVGAASTRALKSMGVDDDWLVVVRLIALMTGVLALVLAAMASWFAFKFQQDEYARATHAADLNEIRSVASDTPGIATVHALTRRCGWHEMQHTALAVMLGMWAWSLSVVAIIFGGAIVLSWFGGASGLLGR